ncbi:MAG: hypothetical protein S4CHLAM37_14770 [Chlamydiia bacterium]|nr:hypothetical protein [Chlamydiia bacterium]
MTDTNVAEIILKECSKEKVFLNLYRFQMHKDFTFADACKRLSYLKDLGITTIYLSPIFQASKGSMHGYDVTNPKIFNKELGSADERDAFFNRADELGLSIIVDIVANHMGAFTENPWWYDVLENGPYSIYADYFDINWNPHIKTLQGKVLVPILESPSSKALEDGMIKIRATDEGIYIDANLKELPINPNSLFLLMHPRLEALRAKVPPELFTRVNEVMLLCKNLVEREDKASKEKRAYELLKIKKELADLLKIEAIFLHIQESVVIVNEDTSLLLKILHKQHFFLEFWQYAPQNINYRRFFDINHLAALKMEQAHVFDDYHEFIFALLKEGRVDGIRIDHPDGFFDPLTYFRRLQIGYIASKYGVNRSTVNDELGSSKPLYIIIEKILEKVERISENWLVSGTVGYEYLNYLNGLFVRRDAKDSFTRIYETFIEREVNEVELLTEEKKTFALLYMTSEMKALTHKLYYGLRTKRKEIAFSQEELEAAIVALFSFFPKYRSYMRLEKSGDILLLSSEDKSAYLEAFEYSEQKYTELKECFAYLRDLFFLQESKLLGFEKEFILRFQQLSPSIMAKGFEDTHLYNYLRLVSLNEVGGFPHDFGTKGIDFHKKMQDKLEKFPYGWITTSTHDTKRSTEMRMRINTLSEIPAIWEKKVAHWKDQNAHFKLPTDEGIFPDLNMEYFIYQTLVGFWPGPVSLDEKENLIERVCDYIVKAARESKAITNWVNHHINYENALEHFVKVILDDKTPFYKSLCEFVSGLRHPSALSSISLLNLTIALPGVLDVYQGTELFDFSLVDPDNRRAIHYGKREELLKEISAVGDPQVFIKECVDKGDFDALKMYVLHRGLILRKEKKALILEGSYERLPLTSETHIAFYRIYQEEVLICISRRFFTSSEKVSFETFPKELQSKKYRDIYTDEVIEIDSNFDLSELLDAYPFTILTASSSS